MGRVHEVSHDHFFLRDTVGEMVGIAAELDAEHGLFSAAQFRDRLDNGRKVAILILEFLDRHGVTLRRGDLRRVNPRRLDLFPRDAGEPPAPSGGESSPVGRPDFKSGRGRETVSGGFNSHSLPPRAPRHRMTDTTDPGFDAYLATLAAAARAASTAELEHQKEAARRAAELRLARAFAWRRLNLVRAVAAAVRGAERHGGRRRRRPRAAFLREVGWNGATQAQRDVADRFAPVALAVWSAGRGEPARPTPAAALAAFEAWYAAERGVPFLALMEREVVELPLVEV